MAHARTVLPKNAPAVEIDLDAVTANFKTLADAAPAAQIAAVVKCDGYGLGAAPVARALAASARCRTFFVAYVEEGAKLRAALADIAPDARILVFNGPDRCDVEAYGEYALTPVLNSREQARLWAASRPDAPAALHIDTGMNRLGAPLGDVSDLAAMRGLKVSMVISHLACGSDPGHPMNGRQQQAFEELCPAFPGAARSLSASAGALMGRAFHYDVIRAGVAIYGVGPFDRPDPRLKPTVTLHAPVIQIRTADKGEFVGYGATHTISAANRTLATVALGYGDGYSRASGNRGAAFIGGAACPIVGRVSMDLITIDVTNAPKPVELGARAEFYGPNIAIERAAEAAGTIGYELLTSLGERLHRRYLFEAREIDPNSVARAEG